MGAGGISVALCVQNLRARCDATATYLDDSVARCIDAGERRAGVDVDNVAGGGVAAGP